jgi:peptidoglycan DL-endopeptidase CwlO
MRPSRTARRVVAALTAAALLIGFAASPVSAEPVAPPNEAGGDTLDAMRSNLEAAAAGYVQAEGALAGAKKRQEEATLNLAVAEADAARLRDFVRRYAGQVYKTGRLGSVSVMLSATSPDAFLTKASALTQLTNRDETRLEDLTAARKKIRDSKAAIDAAVAEQAKFTAEMQQRLAATEKIFASYGSKRSNGFVDPNAAVATPAPRNGDGSWPTEKCNINDPTTTGCITPRTLHAYNEARKAGFTRHTSCYRAGDRWEHPKGRACDFSSAVNGFGGNAIGNDRYYGDKLAAFFVANAKALGVLYVIWYCNIWSNGAWRTYNSAGSRCNDNPSGDHTNHVHLSML